MQLRCMLRTVLAIAAFFPFTTSKCNANNNLFLPGDAFFPTSLTKDGIAKMRDTKTGVRTFEFVATDQLGGAMCGYAGYANATIPSVDDAFVENLVLVFSKIHRRSRSDQRKRTKKASDHDMETDGMRILFYPGSFDFQEHRIGLKYNENWVEETKKFGHDRAHISYGSLVDRADAVAISWRDSSEVEGLQVTIPDVALKPTPMLEAPVIVNEPVRAIRCRISPGFF